MNEIPHWGNLSQPRRKYAGKFDKKESWNGRVQKIFSLKVYDGGMGTNLQGKFLSGGAGEALHHLPVDAQS